MPNQDTDVDDDGNFGDIPSGSDSDWNGSTDDTSTDVLEDTFEDVDGVADDDPLEDIPTDEELDQEEDEALKDVTAATSKKDKSDRAEKRIKQLLNKSKVAANLAQQERNQRLALQKELAEIKASSHSTSLDAISRQEKSLQDRLKQAADDNNMVEGFALMEELAEVKAQKLSLASAPKPSEYVESNNTTDDDLWLAENPNWNSDPVEAGVVQKAWAEVSKVMVPGTSAFYEASDEARDRLRSPTRATPKPQGGTRRKGPPIAGRSSQPRAAKRGQLPPEALTSAKMMGIDITDPEMRKRIAKQWSKK